MTNQMDPNRWSLPLRALHLALAVAVTAQLFIGSFMRSPHPGRPDTMGFVSHEVLGATILMLVVLHWLWAITHPDEGVRHLFPYTAAGLRRMRAEFWQLVRHGQLPAGGPSGRGIAASVHGLGLLAVTATVLIGSTFFVARAASTAQGALNLIEDVHDVFAILTWVYWGGHLAVTVLHSLMHRPLWQDIFRFRD